MQQKFPIQAGGVKGIDQDKWYIFPETLANARFRGLENREDATQLQGAFVVGQNVTFGGASLPSVRYGYEVLGTLNSDSTPVNRAWVFETRSGVQWELKIVDTVLKYWKLGTSTDWGTLLTGLTAGTQWDFANIGKTTNYYTSCLFSNGVDGFYQFTGSEAVVDSTSYAAGSITSIQVNFGGAGYAVGDIITVTGGGGNATYRVTGVTLGVVTSLEATNPGTGYSTSAGTATTTSGAGAGLAVNVVSVGTGYIKVSGTTSVQQLGFLTGKKIIINTHEYTPTTYDGVFFIGFASDPTGEAAGSSILEKPSVVSALSSVQGSVMIAHDGRLHARLSSNSLTSSSKSDWLNFAI